jgi:hypothetical protein
MYTLNQIGQKDALLGEIVGFRDDNNNRPIYKMATEIKVKIIDWTAIVNKFKNSDSNFKDKEFEIREGNGIIFVGEEKLPVLIDDECCGMKAKDKNIMVGNSFDSVRFIDSIGIFEKIEGGFKMCPTYYIDVDYSEIEKCFTGEEQELWQFMGSRYEYNPRIHQNLRGMVKLYKGILKK